MNKIKLAQVAKTLMFEVNPEVLRDLAIEYDLLYAKIKSLKKIDISNLSPMVYVDESPISDLRADEPEHSFDLTVVMKNAPQSKNNLIVLPKVVKDV